MKCVQLLCLAISLVVVGLAEGMSTGAPNGACTTLSPALAAPPSGHGATAQATVSPVSLTMQGGVGYYTAGATYTLTFNRTDGTGFLGFFALARDVNGTNVGEFVAGAGQRQACADLKGITHSTVNRATTQTLVNVQWVAPPKCSGRVTFRFAAVEERITFWAAQTGPVLNETGMPSGMECDSGAFYHLPGTLMIVALALVGVLVTMF